MATVDRHSNFIERSLSRYRLPSDSLWEMRMVLERRYRVKFSEGLSPEGRLAMRQVLEDEGKAVTITEHDIRDTPAPQKGIITVAKVSTPRNAEKTDRKRTISFTDRYKSSHNRLSGDITTGDKSTDLNAAKRAIGGKLESAMETIEIMRHDNATQVVDMEAEVGEAAKIHSMEKCRVWMEVNTDAGVHVSRQDSGI